VVANHDRAGAPTALIAMIYLRTGDITVELPLR
jgi:hypothetical protein